MADARETDSPTPPLHNHVMNNVDLSKEDAKEKNSHGNEENHVTGKMDGSTARQVFLEKVVCYCVHGHQLSFEYIENSHLLFAHAVGRMLHQHEGGWLF